MPMLLLLGDPALTRFFHALQVERCQSYYCRRPLLFVPLVGVLKGFWYFVFSSKYCYNSSSYWKWTLF